MGLLTDVCDPSKPWRFTSLVPAAEDAHGTCVLHINLHISLFDWMQVWAVLQELLSLELREVTVTASDAICSISCDKVFSQQLQFCHGAMHGPEQ